MSKNQAIGHSKRGYKLRRGGRGLPCAQASMMLVKVATRRNEIKVFPNPTSSVATVATGLGVGVAEKHLLRMTASPTVWCHSARFSTHPSGRGPSGKMG